MSYNRDELTAILDSIVEIGSKCDKLSSFSEEYRSFFQKVGGFRNDIINFEQKVNNSETVESVKQEFNALEHMTMENAKTIIEICYAKYDGEDFHPDAEDMGEIFKLMSRARDKITSFKRLLIAYTPRS